MAGRERGHAKARSIFLVFDESAVLELPTTPVLDDVSGVVVARIDSVGRYGVTKVSDTAALEAAARRDAGATSVVVLRVADDIAVTQVIAMTAALGRAGIGHVVLGLVPANVVPPSDGWESCPFPAATDVNSGSASLSRMTPIDRARGGDILRRP